MMRSLYSGVSGLKAHQTKMDVIGNNIANVNTVAYKSQSVTFSDVLYQTTQTASGPNAATGTGGTNAMQIGLGSSVGSISTSTTEGASQRTDNPFDLKISGSAFFIVSSGGSTYFTRAGDFTVDASGALVTTGGASVMGWQVDDDGNVVQDLVSPLYVKSSKFTYTAPESSTSASLVGNINASDSKFSSATGSVPATFNFYDSIGNSYQATVNISKGTDGTGTNVYNVTLGQVTCEGKLTNITGTFAPATVSFDAVTGEVILDTNDLAQLQLTLTNGTVEGSTVDANLDRINGGNGLLIDVSGLTQFAAATDLSKSTNGITVDSVTTGAGKAVGTMTSVGIDESGFIVASYSNGDVMTIGQIAVTTFANAAGLEKIGDNLYAATLNSGLFDGIGQDVTAADGSISSGVLEMSNVDLSSEFTEMITTQRGFQANSRIITVSDTMLEELINLKR